MSTDQATLDRVLAQSIFDVGIVSPEALQRALDMSDRRAGGLVDNLLEQALVDEEVLLPKISETLGLAYQPDAEQLELDSDVLSELSFQYCQTNSVAPCRTPEDQRVILLSRPSKISLCEELEFTLGKGIEIRVSSNTVVRRLLESSTLEDSLNEASVISADIDETNDQDVHAASNDGPVIRYVQSFFEEAVAQGASDIHFEALENGLRVRFRVNGNLRSQPTRAAINTKTVIARLKVMASMNVSERRQPQDGRISAAFSGRKIDFRVSTIPTVFGESVVCRILDPSALRLGWSKLGLTDELRNRVIELIEQPSGLFLVTGPTGSGKTTTLYTALAHLNNEKRKILTVEDPVEYNLAGIEQVQVHEEIGMTFAKALRSFLRQDPDILMVGEIRDQETAEIACRAALVGRMVLSTLHTNSPEGAMTRLIDLGVPSYIVQDVLRGTLGQTLLPSNDGLRKLQAKLVVS